MNRIRITSISPGKGELSISGLQPEEMKDIEAMVNGYKWCLAIHGRLQTQSRWEPLPAPAQDETLMPFWQPSVPGHTQLELKSVEMPPGAPVGIIIESLCGYDYSPENYHKEVEKLESFGFVCMRSRRGDDGHFQEIWYLSGMWRAQGRLKGVLVGIKEPQQQADEAIKFLCKNVKFGSLDVSWQRAAMVIED